MYSSIKRILVSSQPSRSILENKFAMIKGIHIMHMKQHKEMNFHDFGKSLGK